MKKLILASLIAMLVAPLAQAQKAAPRRQTLKEVDVRVDQKALNELNRNVEAKLGLGEHSKRAVDALKFIRSENLQVAKDLVSELSAVRTQLAIYVPRIKLDAVSSKVNELISLELEALAYDRSSTVPGKETFVLGQKNASEVREYIEQVKANVEEFSGRDPSTKTLIDANQTAMNNQIKIARDTAAFLLRGSTGLVSVSQRSTNTSQQVYSLQYARKMAAWSFLVENDSSLRDWAKKFPETARNSREYKDAKIKALEEIMKNPEKANKWQEILRCLLGASLAKAA